MARGVFYGRTRGDHGTARQRQSQVTRYRPGAGSGNRTRRILCGIRSRPRTSAFNHDLTHNINPFLACVYGVSISNRTHSERLSLFQSSVNRKSLPIIINHPQFTIKYSTPADGPRTNHVYFSGATGFFVAEMPSFESAEW